MSLINTIQQIFHSDSVSPLQGLVRHMGWQSYRLTRRYPAELSISRSRMAVFPDSGVMALINCLGLYDFNNMSLIQAVLRPGDAFIDVGANLGAYTLIASEIDAVNVISFEPDPTTYQRLLANLAMNARQNVTALNQAVSDLDGQVNLAVGRQSELNHVIPGAQPGEQGIAIPAVRLDTLLAQQNLHPAVLKVDVEGYEEPVLAGLGDEITQLRLALIENGERPSIAARFHLHGFLGPLYIHYRRRRFEPFPQRRPEDALFLSRELAVELQAGGFTFAAGWDSCAS